MNWRRKSAVTTTQIPSQKPSSLVQSLVQPLLPENERVLRLPEVMKKVGLGRSNILEKVRLGLFPKPISLGGRAVGWLEQSQVNAWLSNCIAESRNGTQGGRRESHSHSSEPRYGAASSSV